MKCWLFTAARRDISGKSLFAIFITTRIIQRDDFEQLVELKNSHPRPELENLEFKNFMLPPLSQEHYVCPTQFVWNQNRCDPDE